MGLIDLLMPGRHDDPILGSLVRGWGCWSAQITLGDGESVPLVLAGWRSTPDSGRLRLSRGSRARMRSGRTSRRCGWLIEQMAGRETVEIAYRAAWDEEHTLGVRFHDWALVEVNGSVRV